MSDDDDRARVRVDPIALGTALASEAARVYDERAQRARDRADPLGELGAELGALACRGLALGLQRARDRGGR